MPHYSVQLGRWVDDDEEEAYSGADPMAANPYRLPGPMPSFNQDLEGGPGQKMPGDNTPDMDFSLEEANANAASDRPGTMPDIDWSPLEEAQAARRQGMPSGAEFSLDESELNRATGNDQDFSPEEAEVYGDVRRGVNELDSPIRQQTMRTASLGSADEQPGRWETTSRRQAEALAMPFKGSPNGFDPNKARANRPAEWGPNLPNETLPPQAPLGAPEIAQQQVAPQTGAWADYGPLSRPDETWAGAEGPMRQPVDVAGPQAAPRGPMPPPPPDLGPSQIRHDASTAQGSSTDPAAGVRNQMGINTDDPDPLNARLAETLRLHNLQQQQQGPQAEEAPYQPYQPQGHRQSDGDIQRAYITNLIGGGAGQAQGAVNMMRGLNQDYDRRNQSGEEQNFKRWMAEHKMRDMDQPLTAGEKQQVVAAGLMSPEAAQTATRRSLDAAKSLGAIGTREKKIEQDVNKTVIQAREKDFGRAQTQDFEGRKFERQDETKRRGQDKNLEVMREKMAGQGQNTQDARAARIQTAMKVGNLSRDEAIDAVDNGTGNLRPTVRDRVDAALLGIDAQGQDGKAIGRIGASLTIGDARVADSVEKGRRDPKALYKIDNALGESAESFKPAYMAVHRLKTSGSLDKMAKLGTEGWADAVKKGLVSGKDQADMSEAYNFMGEYAHGRYGSAFTGGEQKQLENATGVKFGSGVSPVNSPEVILRFFSAYKRILQAREERAQKHFGDSVGGN